MVLPTYDGKVQPMNTVWDSCPLMSTAYSSMSKLWSNSICKQICPLTNDQLRWEGADVVLPTYDGKVQPMATLWEACSVRTTAYSSISKVCSKSAGKNAGMLTKLDIK